MRVLFPFPRTFGFFPDIYEYVTLLRECGVEAYYVGLQHRHAQPEMPPYAIHLTEKDAAKKHFLAFVQQQIAEIRPDIVHAYHFRGCGALPFAARKAADKWIVDVRTIHVETRGGKITSDFWLRDRVTWLETQAFDYILALTTTIQGKLKPSLRPIEIIPLGASLSKLSSTRNQPVRAKIRYRLDIPEEAPLFLYAGSLSPTRQLDKIMRGFALAVEQFPGARLLIVGGDLGYKPEADPAILSLKKIALEQGISANVLFTGRVPYADIPTYFAAADVGISYMPRGTPHQYQPPTKLIEYMMAGLIAVSNRIPAIEGLIEDSVNGILCGETEEEIASGLHRSLVLLDPRNQDSYQRLTTNARHAVRNRDWQHIVSKRLIPVYEKLCGKRV